MKSIARLTTLLTFFVLAVSCERSAPSKSRVSIAMNGRVAANFETIEPAPVDAIVDVGACSICLKSIVINIDGDDFPTIEYSNRASEADMMKAADEIKVLTDFEVPTGPDRLFQVLAIYLDARTSELKMQYGIASVSLANPDEAVPIKMEWLNGSDQDPVLKPAGIVGKYLTGPDSGPTGVVRLFYKHEGKTSMKMPMGRAEINNGWFNFNALENFPITYKLEGTGEIIFEDATLQSLNDADVNHRAIVTAPDYFYRRNVSTWDLTQGYGRNLYGYFTAPGSESLIGTKKVVLQTNGSTAIPLNYMSFDAAGSSYLGFYFNNNLSSEIYGSGGTSGPVITNLALYQANDIYVAAQQFNGGGKQTARAMEGAFSFRNTTPGVVRYVTGGTNPYYVYLSALPGLFTNENRYGGIKVFKKTVEDNDREAISCDSDWLANRGFIEDPLFSVSVAATEVSFSLPYRPLGTETYIVCPTLSGTSTTESFGGMYLGKFPL